MFIAGVHCTWRLHASASPASGHLAFPDHWHTFDDLHDRFLTGNDWWNGPLGTGLNFDYYTLDPLKNALPDDQYIRQSGEHRGGIRRIDDTVYQEHSDSWLGFVRYIAQNYYQIGRGFEYNFSDCRYDYNQAGNAAGYADLFEAFDDCYAQYFYVQIHLHLIHLRTQ